MQKTDSPQDDSQLQRHALSNDWQLSWSQDLATIAPLWDELPATENVFLTTDYFRLVQDLHLPSLQPKWAVFSHP
ncbi:MAG: hypothetical protein AAGJ82_05895, partial [Bacteroidota bacterium]